MSSIFSDGALHPGRDPNDAVWMVLRRAEDWASATMTDVVFDPARIALLLAPGPLSTDDTGTTVVGPDGCVYRSDPAGDRVLRRCNCEDWRLFVGARGFETGKLVHPLGLALDPRRELLAIADTGNHRVQIVRAGSGDVVIVLAGMTEPVAVTFGAGRLAVADRAAGRIRIYDDRFVLVGMFAPVPPRAPSGFVPAPARVAIVGCVVWVVDQHWSIPEPYDFGGEPTTATDPPPELLVGVQYAPAGEVMIGPIDGRADDLAWHRVIVDAELPAGTALEIQTFASDDPIAPPVIAWAPASPVPLPLTGVDSTDGESDRLVLSDQGRWQRKRAEPYLRMVAPIATLPGTGPISTNGFAAEWPLARTLRTGDVIALRTASAEATNLTIVAIGGRTVQATARGTLQLYGPGATVSLIERDGIALAGGPRLLVTLAAGDTLDLSAAADDGTLYDLPASHAVAAMLRDGDTATVTDGVVSATIIVALVVRDPVGIAFVPPVVGDFSSAAVRIQATSDRLIVESLPWDIDVPHGEQLIVYDDIAGTSQVAQLRWAQPDVATVWLEPGPPVPYATWTRFTVPDPVATDRGRYLWLRLRFEGAVAHLGDPYATATPLVRSVRLLMPRPSLLRYLPAVYARRDDNDPSGALFLERYLALPERLLTTVEALYEQVARMVDPRASSPEWLAFIASWFGLVFDPSWPAERRRQLVIHANELFAHRGTLGGMVQYLEIYLGVAPAIVEDFRWGGPNARAHHFTIWVQSDGAACSADLVDRAARAIIESIKPAHTTYDLHVISGSPRVGITSRVGIDMVLVGGEAVPPLGITPSHPAVLGQLALPIAEAPSPRLGPISLDEDFTLS